MASKLTRVLNKLNIDEKELAKEMGISLAAVRMMRNSSRMPVSKELLQKAEKYVEKIAENVLKTWRTSKRKKNKHRSDAAEAWVSTGDGEVDNLDALKDQYEKKFRKPVPPRYSKNEEWIRSKLS